MQLVCTPRGRAAGERGGRFPRGSPVALPFPVPAPPPAAPRGVLPSPRPRPAPRSDVVCIYFEGRKKNLLILRKINLRCGAAAGGSGHVCAPPRPRFRGGAGRRPEVKLERRRRAAGTGVRSACAEGNSMVGGAAGPRCGVWGARGLRLGLWGRTGLPRGSSGGGGEFWGWGQAVPDCPASVGQGGHSRSPPRPP